MLTPELSADHNVWLRKLAAHLRSESYSRDGREIVAMSRRFLIHLQKKGLTVHNVQSTDVTKYLSGAKRLRRSPHRLALSAGQRSCYRSALHMLLRMVHGASGRRATLRTRALSPQIARGIRRLDDESTGSMLDDSRDTLRQLVAVPPMAR